MIKMIFAIGPNNEFGTSDNRLPWQRIKEDMQYFSRYTMNSIVIMGRHTWESLPEQKLPGRDCVVVTSTEIEGVACAGSLVDAITLAEHVVDLAGREIDICIIGGRSLLEEAVQYVDELSITKIANDALLALDWNRTVYYLDAMNLITTAETRGLTDYDTEILSGHATAVTLKRGSL